MEDLKHYQVRRRVKELKGLYLHLSVYLLVNCILLVVNIVTRPQYFWFVWPALGWGIGVGFHALAVFDVPWFFGRKWEAKMVQKILEKKNK